MATWPQTRPPPNCVGTLFQHAGSEFTIFFITYVVIVVFAIVRIITALFLKETLQAAANDAEIMIAERQEKKKKLIENLEEVFKDMPSHAVAYMHTHTP